MSNEKEIRRYIKNIITEYDEDIQIVDEFCGGAMQTRMDLALFKKDIFVSVEIKSDKDTLSRLEEQIRDYKEYATVNIIVLDIVHKKAFEKFLDKSKVWGKSHSYIYFYDNGKLDREFNFSIFTWFNEIKRTGTKLSSLLWRDEKKKLIYFIKGRSKVDLDDIVLQIYTIYELAEITLHILYTRAILNKDTRGDKSHFGFTCGTPPKIKNKEYKQILFNEYLESRKKEWQ